MIFFNIFNNGNGTYTLIPYDPMDSIYLFLLGIGGMFISGLLVYKHLSIPYFAIALFLALVFLLPFPAASGGLLLIFFVLMDLALGSIVYSGFKVGLLLGVVPLGIVIIMSFLSLGGADDMGALASILLVINLGLFCVFLASMPLGYADVLYSIIAIEGGIGILMIIIGLACSLVKDKKMPGSLLLCIIMFLLGCVPVGLAYYLYDPNAKIKESTVAITMIFLISFVCIGFVNRVLTKKFNAYEISNCTPAMAPFVFATAIPMLYHQSEDAVVCVRVAERILDTAKRSDLGLRFETLDYFGGWPRGIGAILRIIVFGAVLLAASGAMDYMFKKKN